MGKQTVYFTKVVIPLAFIQVRSMSIDYCTLWKAWRSSCSQISSKGTRHVSTQGCLFKGASTSADFCPEGWEQKVHSLVTSALPEGLRPHRILPQTGINSTIYSTEENLQIPSLWKRSQGLYRES